MVDDPVVAVRGEVIREVPPEIARFSVTVAARDKERQATLARLAARSEAVRALIDGYGAAIERRETGGLQVRPELKRAGERVAAYQGSVTTTVTVSDFTVLGELMLRLADQDQTGVAGPWWELRPDSPVHGEARRAAIGEALTRAREYADALGARVTGLLELADTGLANQPMMRTVAYGATGAEWGGAAVPELQLDPQVQTVQTAVEARFAISEPTAVTRPAG
ncbi:SIMPL domain-containing protein [Micromonospora sp. NPDC049679]|uniref:SIMPL domain-containing protein n=1 Tax=Micromonospora sp. NPDC049679 TaxID=3155920 RepID=UPI00340BFEAD